MIDYIKVIDYQLNVVGEHKIKMIDEPFSKFMNKLLKPYLVNLSSREKTTKRIFGFFNKVPLIINQDILLICIQSYRTNQGFYINYHQILYWEKVGNKVHVFFKSNHCICLDSYHVFIQQMGKAKYIINLYDRIEIK